MYAPFVSGASSVAPINTNGDLPAHLLENKGCGRGFNQAAMRLLKLECQLNQGYHQPALPLLQSLNMTDEKKDDGGNNNNNTEIARNLLLGDRSNLLYKCRYTIVTNTCSSTTTSTINTAIEDAAAVKSACLIHISSEDIFDKRETIKAEGVCILVGRLPTNATYIIYKAIGQYIFSCDRIPFKRKQLNSLFPAGELAALERRQFGNIPVFKMVDMVGIQVRSSSDLRIRDLSYLLHVEIGSPHLFEPFLRDSGIKCDVRSSFQDPWRPSMLIKGGENRLYYSQRFPSTKWFKLNGLKGVLTSFPQLLHFLLTSMWSTSIDVAEMTVTFLRDLRSVLKDNTRNWTLFIDPLAILKLCPKLFIPLLVDDMGCRFEYNSVTTAEDDSALLNWYSKTLQQSHNKRIKTALMCSLGNDCNSNTIIRLPQEKSELVSFYNNEIVRALTRDGSTALVLSDRILSKKTSNTDRYSSLFVDGLKSSKIVLQSLCLVDMMVPVTFQNIHQLILSQNTKNNSEAHLPLWCRESLPDSTFTLARYWDTARDVISGLYAVKSRGKDALSKNLSTFASTLDYNNAHSLLTALSPSSFPLTSEQICAVLSTLVFPIVSVLGMPGTGKTTVIEAIYRLYLGEGGEDVGIVAVVTHGGCMAAELAKRGIKRAKTICSALLQRTTSSIKNNTNQDESEEEEDGSPFDYENVQVLVIDEFSNVSDSLAAFIYSPTCFPNLRCIVHVYDPKQTGPIEEGSLSTDYMQTFPSFDSYYKRVTGRASKLLSDSTTPSRSLITMRKCYKDRSEPHCKMLALYAFLSEYVSTNTTAVHSLLPSFGISFVLLKAQRFQDQSLACRNDKIIMDGCKEPFTYDNDTFVNIPCSVALEKQLYYVLKGVVGGSMSSYVAKKREPLLKKESLQATLGKLYASPLGGYIKSVLGSQQRGEHDFQLLAFTNKVCEPINLACSFAHFMENDCFDDNLGVFPFVTAGSKLLIRENKPGRRIRGKYLGNTRDELYDLLAAISEQHVTPKLLKVRKADFFNHRNYAIYKANKAMGCNLEEGDPPVGGFDDDPDTPLMWSPKEVYASTLSMDDYIDVLYESLKVKLSSCDNGHIVTSSVTNGTLFTFTSSTFYRTRTITPTELLNALDGKAEEIVTMLEHAITTVEIQHRAGDNKSGESITSLRSILRREALRQYHSLYTPDMVCDLLVKLESKRWCADPWSNEIGAKTPLFSSRNSISKKTISTWCSSSTTTVVFNYALILFGSDSTVLALDKTHFPASMLKPGWAITVNFSQGKEYSQVALVLPKYDPLTAQSSSSTTEHSSIGFNKGRMSIFEDSSPKAILARTEFATFDVRHVHVAITRYKKRFVLLGDRNDLFEIATRNANRLCTRFTLMLPILYTLQTIEDKKNNTIIAVNE